MEWPPCLAVGHSRRHPPLRSRRLGGPQQFEPALWSRAAPLVDELLDLEAAPRAERLASLAASDRELYACVEACLAAADTEELLPRSAGELVALLGAREPGVSTRIGERLGPFRVLEEIGRGGMGAVYAAERVEGGFEQQVAIKTLKRGLDTDEVLSRFVAERRILARLEHPNIARLIDGGLTGDGLPWFAMERVDGRPITEEAERRGLTSTARLSLFLDVCGAVAFAHRQRVVHRDLKPSNVLLDQRGAVKLLDFGIAKLLDPGDERLTRTESRVLTPKYAAPEQIAGARISEATDVWQLGRLLQELLPRPWQKDLERIADRASHDEPAHRYGSVDELAEDVRRFLHGRPVVARGDSYTYRLGRFVRRHRSGAIAAAVVLLAVLAWLLLPRSRPEDLPGASLRFEPVSTFPGSHRQASFSPDGRSIAFVMEDAVGAPQVWTKELDGGDPVQVTTHEVGAHRPRWSSRENQIVYDVPGEGIWSVPASGGEPRRLLREGYNPNVSRDGEQLVYEKDAELWAARADGSEARRVGAGAESAIEKEYAFVESTPAFSPDGREIVYFQDRDTPVQGDVWSVPVDGGASRRLTFDDVLTSHPVYTPDGSGIVYSSTRRGGMTLWFLPRDGGEPRSLTTGTGEDTEAAISPDGKRLLYTNARNLLRILWLDPRTGERRQLLEKRTIVTHPSFSPDGVRLVVFQGEPRNTHLFTLRADGTELRQLTHGEGEVNVAPNWSGDGSHIYYCRVVPQPGFLRIAADGGSPEVVIPGLKFSVQHGPHVSSDDRWAAYTLLEHGRPVATRIRRLQDGVEHELAQPLLWPRWSPDGTLLAGRGRDRELLLCPASGAACRALGLDGTEPRWSADGSEIYFVRYAGYQGSRETRAMPLWKVRVDGSQPTHVADLEGPSARDFFYDVSASGEIAWASFVAGRQELWMADLTAERDP